MSKDHLSSVSLKQRVSRKDWIRESIAVLGETGIKGLKIVEIAKRMGVTSGSFYWHFSGLSDLLDAILDHWEHHLTDHIIQDALNFSGSSEQRILNLMKQVISEGAGEHDHAISIWSRSDHKVREVYDRTLTRRFKFCTSMFEQANFSPDAAKVRGRLIVAYLMGESTSNLKYQVDWESTIEAQFDAIMCCGKLSG